MSAAPHPTVTNAQHQPALLEYGLEQQVMASGLRLTHSHTNGTNLIGPRAELEPLRQVLAGHGLRQIKKDPQHPRWAGDHHAWYMPLSRAVELPPHFDDLIELLRQATGSRITAKRDTSTLRPPRILSARVPDLTKINKFIINSSAGKDSQAMLDMTARVLRAAGRQDDAVVLHNDLGQAEWPGTVELAQNQALFYGLSYRTVQTRPQGDLLDQIAAVGKFPGMGHARYCTSDQKTGQTLPVLTEMRRDSGQKQMHFLYCLGERAEESAVRSCKSPNDRWNKSNSVKVIDRWLPVHPWKIEDVWDTIADAKAPYHPAYDLGMSRLSCCFCIFANESDLIVAARANRDLADKYVELERSTGHLFQPGRSIESVVGKARKLADLHLAPPTELWWGNAPVPELVFAEFDRPGEAATRLF